MNQARFAGTIEFFATSHRRCRRWRSLEIRQGSCPSGKDVKDIIGHVASGKKEVLNVSGHTQESQREGHGG